MKPGTLKKQPLAMPANSNNPPLLKVVGSDPIPETVRIVGYARISKDDQHIDMQLALLKAAGVQQIFEEQLSAVSAKRPQWHLVLKYLEPGDTLVFYAFNRLYRDLKKLLGFVDDMKVLGVTLKSITEPHIDAFTHHGRMILSMTGAVDEHERSRLCERTRDGMQERKRQGMYLGAPRKITDTKAAQMRIDRLTMTMKQLKRKYKVSEGTINKYAPKGAK